MLFVMESAFRPIVELADEPRSQQRQHARTEGFNGTGRHETAVRGNQLLPPKVEVTGFAGIGRRRSFQLVRAPVAHPFGRQRLACQMAQHRLPQQGSNLRRHDGLLHQTGIENHHRRHQSRRPRLGHDAMRQGAYRLNCQPPLFLRRVPCPCPKVHTFRVWGHPAVQSIYPLRPVSESAQGLTLQLQKPGGFRPLETGGHAQNGLMTMHAVAQRFAAFEGETRAHRQRELTLRATALHRRVMQRTPSQPHQLVAEEVVPAFQAILTPMHMLGVVDVASLPKRPRLGVEPGPQLLAGQGALVKGPGGVVQRRIQHLPTPGGRVLAQERLDALHRDPGLLDGGRARDHGRQSDSRLRSHAIVASLQCASVPFQLGLSKRENCVR